jgi:predicted enzyme related to lactoylglutathione lyase
MRSWNFHADNLDEMTRFYQNALGAELRGQQTIGGVKVARLRAGDTGLGFFDASEKRAAGVPHHTFDIEGPGDPKELIKELEAKGIKVDDMRLHGEGPGYSVYVIDPAEIAWSFPKTKSIQAAEKLQRSVTFVSPLPVLGFVATYNRRRVLLWTAKRSFSP